MKSNIVYPSNLPPLVLASQSPRRRELLVRAGVPFRVDAPEESVEAECGVCSQQSPDQLVARLAFQKASHIAARHSRALVLGCDTVAECQGWILGKPRDVQDARRILEQMSGREHRVYTGLCLIERPTNRFWGRVGVTRLRMDRLGEEQLQRYLQTDQWIGKAGAFGYQDGLDWVHILQGSESNVVGLPLEDLQALLQEASNDLRERKSSRVRPTDRCGPEVAEQRRLREDLDRER